MFKLFGSKSQPASDARIDELADQIGEAQARGDAKAEKKLRTELEPLVESRNLDVAEDRIAEARAVHEGRHRARQSVDAYRDELTDLARARADLGERIRAAADELTDAWAEHERLHEHFDGPLRRRRAELVKLTRHHGVEVDVPCVPGLEEALGVGSGLLHPMRLLARIHEKNDRGRVVFEPKPTKAPERPWHGVERWVAEEATKDRRAG